LPHSPRDIACQAGLYILPLGQDGCGHRQQLGLLIWPEVQHREPGQQLTGHIGGVRGGEHLGPEPDLPPAAVLGFTHHDRLRQRQENDHIPGADPVHLIHQQDLGLDIEEDIGNAGSIEFIAGVQRSSVGSVREFKDSS